MDEVPTGVGDAAIPRLISGRGPLGSLILYQNMIMRKLVHPNEAIYFEKLKRTEMNQRPLAA